MNEIILYILQANLFLAVSAIVYRYLLSKDTFFTVRRIFLISTIFLSFVYEFFPALTKMDFRAEDQAISVVNFPIVDTEIPMAVVEQSSVFNLENILLAVWFVGSVILLIKFFIGLCSIIRVRNRGRNYLVNGTNVILVNYEVIPFSFCKWIFLSRKQLESNDTNDIIAHEKAHVKGFHSFDVIVGECLKLLFWFNPAVWYYNHSIKVNLEFLADRDVLDCGHSRKDYQYKLLTLSSYSPINQLINYFNVSQLKNRIIMMNKERTPRKNLLKYGFTLAVLMLLTLTNNAQIHGQQKDTTVKMDSLKVGHSKVKESTVDSILRTLPAPTFKIYKDSLSMARDIEKRDTSTMTKGSSSTDRAPLFIIRGKKATLKEFSYLDPESIYSITVLKNEEAEEKYGYAAKNGVVVVEIIAEKENK